MLRRAYGTFQTHRNPGHYLDRLLAQAEFDSFAKQMRHLGYRIECDRCVGGVQQPVKAGAAGL